MKAKIMDLPTWMEKNNVHDDLVAHEVGCTRPYINRIRHGLIEPKLAIALAIWNYTRREIDLEMLLPLRMRPKTKVKQPAAPQRAIGRPRKTLARPASKSLARA